MPAVGFMMLAGVGPAVATECIPEAAYSNGQSACAPSEAGNTAPPASPAPSAPSTGDEEVPAPLPSEPAPTEPITTPTPIPSVIPPEPVPSAGSATPVPAPAELPAQGSGSELQESTVPAEGNTVVPNSGTGAVTGTQSEITGGVPPVAAVPNANENSQLPGSPEAGVEASATRAEQSSSSTSAAPSWLGPAYIGVLIAGTIGVAAWFLIVYLRLRKPNAS